MANESITVPKWEYQDKNIQGDITQKNFTRADRVIIYAGPTPAAGQKSEAMKAVGMIQGMNHNESKQLQMLFELGSAAPMIVPGLTQGQISIQRVLLNGINFLNAIYHGADATNIPNANIVRSIRDVNRPFDLMIAKYPVLDSWTPDAPSQDNTPTKAIETTLFRGCQFQSRSESISAGGVVVFEQANIMYQYIPKVTYSLK